MKNVALLTEARTAARTGQGAKLREAALLSQGELARFVGVSAAAVSRWESGHRQPSGAEAIRYARMLRILRANQDKPVQSTELEHAGA